MLGREKEKAYSSSICPDLKPLYPVATKPYPVGYVMPQFQNFDGIRGNARQHVFFFLDSNGAHTNDTDLCIRELSKPLTVWAYT